MTDIEQRAREMLIDACRYCGVEGPPGYLLAPFDEDSGPWMVAQRLARLAAIHPNAEEAEAERRGMLAAEMECHGLDTPERVCFYEQDFYVLSNFSAFNVRWGPYTFQTSEHMYHWRRFFLAGGYYADMLADKIMKASSAHDAFRIAQGNKAHQVDHWDDVKVGEMREILRLKTEQHEYVRRKLLATGDRELIENSWRDDFWGWGPNREGQNMLGKLWMEIRAAIRAAAQPSKDEQTASIKEQPHG